MTDLKPVIKLIIFLLLGLVFTGAMILAAHLLSTNPNIQHWEDVYKISLIVIMAWGYFPIGIAIISCLDDMIHNKKGKGNAS